MSDEEIFECAAALRTAPPLDYAPSEDDETVDQQKSNKLYRFRTRERLLKYLKAHLHVPSSAKWIDCANPEHPRVLSLHTNYDHPCPLEVQDRLTAKLKPYLKAERSEFKWYWDLEMCGAK